MKWRDLALTALLLLLVAPYLTAQTMPVVGSSTVSGGVGLFADGACGSTPSLAFVSDSDTGFFRKGSGQVGFCTNGAVGPQFNGNQFGTTNGGLLTAVSIGPTTSGGVTLGSNAIASGVVTNGNDGSSPSAFSLAGSRVLAVSAGGLGLATVATSSVGITGQGARLVVVCGPTSGTSSLLYYSGTSNTPVTLANAVGGGLIGC